MLVNEIGCLLARTKNESQKPAALALGSDFAAADEITLRDYTDQFASRVNHRKPADMPLQHGVCGFDDRGLGCDGDDRPGHNLMGPHWDLRVFKIEFVIESVFQFADSHLTEIKGPPKSGG
jgi:hypothetical protein